MTHEEIAVNRGYLEQRLRREEVECAAAQALLDALEMALQELTQITQKARERRVQAQTYRDNAEQDLALFDHANGQAAAP